MAYFHHFGSKITFFLCRFPYFCQLFEPNIGENNKVEYSNLAYSNGIMCKFEEKHNFWINSVICIYFLRSTQKKFNNILYTLYEKWKSKISVQKSPASMDSFEKSKKKTSKMILLM